MSLLEHKARHDVLRHTYLSLVIKMRRHTSLRKGCFRAAVTGIRTAPLLFEKLTPPLSSTCFTKGLCIFEIQRVNACKLSEIGRN